MSHDDSWRFVTTTGDDDGWRRFVTPKFKSYENWIVVSCVGPSYGVKQVLHILAAICFRKLTHTAGAIFSDVAKEMHRRERMQCISEGFINSALMNPAMLQFAQIPLGNVPTPTDRSHSLILPESMALVKRVLQTKCCLILRICYILRWDIEIKFIMYELFNRKQISTELRFGSVSFYWLYSTTTIYGSYKRIEQYTNSQYFFIGWGV